jgi:hypothetical protein
MYPTLLRPNPRRRMLAAQPPLSPVACFFPPPSPLILLQLQVNNLASAQPPNKGIYLPMHSTFQVSAWPGPDCAAFHSTLSPRCEAVWLNNARSTPAPSELPGRGGGGDAGGGGLAMVSPLNDPEVESKSGSTNGWIQALTAE